ncbi:unnamed protein product, partial [Rotaria sordida]
MATIKKSYLETLPAEVLHRIYDELDAETILFSIRCVSKRLYSITNNYNRYRLDFHYMSISNIRVMARIIDPKNVISLTLSDEEESYGEISLFLSHFHLDQFIRLRSLTLINLRDRDADLFENYINKCCLTTVSISFDYPYPKNIKQLLTSIVSLNGLRKLELACEDRILDDLQWPIQCRVENLTISGRCKWNIIYFILNHSPYLRTLVLKLFDIGESDENIVTQSDVKQFNNLVSLSLYIRSRIKISDIYSILTFLPNLTHLRLSGWIAEDNLSSCNGHQWANLIQTKLPLLKQFEFHFSHQARANQDCTIMESLIESFRTPFWLENNSWIVKYDYECDEDILNGRQIVISFSRDHADLAYGSRVYTIPVFQNDFDYSNRQIRVINSILNTIDKNEPIVVNSYKLTIDVNRMMTENIQEK